MRKGNDGKPLGLRSEEGKLLTIRENVLIHSYAIYSNNVMFLAMCMWILKTKLFLPLRSYLPPSSSNDNLEGAASSGSLSTASASSHPLTAFTMPLAFFGVDAVNSDAAAADSMSSPTQPRSATSPSHLALLAGSFVISIFP